MKIIIIITTTTKIVKYQNIITTQNNIGGFYMSKGQTTSFINNDRVILFLFHKVRNCVKLLLSELYEISKMT